MEKNVSEFELLDLDKPEVIGAVITKLDDRINLCPVNWQVVSSSYEKPPAVCIGLSHGSYTLETILKTKEFTYAYPSREQLKDILYCGTVSGRIVDKLKNTSFKFIKAKLISVPLLDDAVLNFECSLFKTVDMENFTIVIGKGIKYHTSSKSSLDKVYSLGGYDYGVIDKVKVLQRGRK